MIVSPRKTSEPPKRSTPKKYPVKEGESFSKSMKKTVSSDKFKTTILTFSDTKIKKIADVSNPETFKELRLTGTQLVSFVGMKTMKSLKILRIEKTKIESFKGAAIQPSLEYFIIKDTPLSYYPFCPIMSRIVFGPSLKYVGDHPISKKEKETADKLSTVVYDYLIEGWLLTSIDPIRIYNPETQERKKLFLLDDFVPITMQSFNSPTKPLSKVPPAAPSTPSNAASKARDEEMLSNLPDEDIYENDSQDPLPNSSEISQEEEENNEPQNVVFDGNQNSQSPFESEESNPNGLNELDIQNHENNDFLGINE